MVGAAAAAPGNRFCVRIELLYDLFDAWKTQRETSLGALLVGYAAVNASRTKPN